MNNFAIILEELIFEKGLSLRKLELDSGISAVNFSKYLRGSYPTIELAFRLAKYFDCSLDYLFGLTDKRKIKDFTKYDISVFVPRYLKALSDSGISHWRFSKKYGLSESNLRHWKSGDNPSIESLIIIANNLPVTIDYLIGIS